MAAHARPGLRPLGFDLTDAYVDGLLNTLDVIRLHGTPGDATY